MYVFWAYRRPRRNHRIKVSHRITLQYGTLTSIVKLDYKKNTGETRTYGTSFRLAMGNHIYKRYPQLFDAIQALEANDATFRDVCADYDEICNWLAAHGEFNSIRDPEENANARELKRDLEDEILKLLEEHDANIR